MRSRSTSAWCTGRGRDGPSSAGGNTTASGPEGSTSTCSPSGAPPNGWRRRGRRRSSGQWPPLGGGERPKPQGSPHRRPRDGRRCSTERAETPLRELKTATTAGYALPLQRDSGRRVRQARPPARTAGPEQGAAERGRQGSREERNNEGHRTEQPHVRRDVPGIPRGRAEAARTGARRRDAERTRRRDDGPGRRRGRATRRDDRVGQHPRLLPEARQAARGSQHRNEGRRRRQRLQEASMTREAGRVDRPDVRRRRPAARQRLAADARVRARRRDVTRLPRGGPRAATGRRRRGAARMTHTRPRGRRSRCPDHLVQRRLDAERSPGTALLPTRPRYAWPSVGRHRPSAKPRGHDVRRQSVDAVGGRPRAYRMPVVAGRRCRRGYTALWGLTVRTGTCHSRVPDP